MLKEKIQKVAVHGLIKKGDKYLVLRRSKINDYMPGKWDLPGGSIEFGEKIETALKREINEETSLKINHPKFYYIFSFVHKNFRHQFQLVYLCDFLRGNIKLNPEEHDEYRWVALKDLKQFNKIAFLDALYNQIFVKE